MKFYFITSSILLTAAIALGDNIPSASEKFNITLDNIKIIHSKIESNRSTARRNHDMILFNCLNDASHRIYAVSKQIEEKHYAPSTQDADTADKVLTRVQQIESDANNCLGSTSIFQANSYKTSFSIDDSIPNIDPTLSSINIIIEPPNCASCFR